MMNKEFIISAPLTHIDWLGHPDGPEWGPDGVRVMLERCKEFGFKRIYWRVFDCGRTTYASKLADPFKWDEHDKVYQYSDGFIDLPPVEIIEKLKMVDYNNFDSLEAATKIGHELGLEIHAWLTINEEDHGLGWSSRFSKQNPEMRWTRQDGKRYHSQLSFAFPEVREYKLGLMKEILKYDVDGIFLDWIRTGDIRDNPQSDENGVADYGYELPNIERFKEKYGINPYDIENGDERWVASRAEPITLFMRQARDSVSRHAKSIPLTAMISHPWAYRGVLPGMITDETPKWLKNVGGNVVDGSLRGILCDIRTWAREGLVDELVAAGYYTGEGTPEKAYKYVVSETEGKVPVCLYCWVPGNLEEYRRSCELAEKLGTNRMLFWEADYIDLKPKKQFKLY